MSGGCGVSGQAGAPRARYFSKEPKESLLIRFSTAARKYWFIYLLAIPGLLFLLVFSYAPMYGVVLAFKDFKMNLGVMGSPWVGLYHYRELFADPAFIQAFKNTVIINIYNLIFGFTFNVFLALMINELQMKRLKSVVQTCVYLPYFLSWVIFAGLVQVFLQAPVPGDVGGVVNQVIQAMGGEPIDFMKRPEMFRGILVITNIIKTAGYLSGRGGGRGPRTLRGGLHRWRQPPRHAASHYDSPHPAQRGGDVPAEHLAAVPVQLRPGL